MSNPPLDTPSNATRQPQQAPNGQDRTPDRAERLVIMNGSRLHERHLGGQWTVMDSEPQGMNPRGIHRLDTARDADPKTKGEYRGAVLHVDKANIYQLGNDSQVVRHDRDRFKETPHVGEGARIGYDNGRGVMLNRSIEPAASRSIAITPTRTAPDKER